MLPLARILCPIDFSEPSYAALAVAEELAEHFDASLVVLHVVDEIPLATAATPARSPASSSLGDFDIHAYRSAVREHGVTLLHEALADRITRPVRIREHVAEGNAADVIVELAEQESADVVVIASRGLTGVKRLLFGSVAEKVVRTADCPVLTIPVHD